MSQGEIVQVGTPEQLFETPAHRFVGHFIGSPGMNFLACEWNSGAATIGGSARRDQQHAGAAGRRFVVDRSAAGVSRARVDIGAEHRTGARRCDSRPGHPDDGATGNRCVARLGEAAQLVPMDLRSGTAFARLPPARCALYADERRVP